MSQWHEPWQWQPICGITHNYNVISGLTPIHTNFQVRWRCKMVNGDENSGSFFHCFPLVVGGIVCWCIQVTNDRGGHLSMTLWQQASKKVGLDSTRADILSSILGTSFSPFPHYLTSVKRQTNKQSVLGPCAPSIYNALSFPIALVTSRSTHFVSVSNETQSSYNEAYIQ